VSSTVNCDGKIAEKHVSDTAETHQVLKNDSAIHKEESKQGNFESMSQIQDNNLIIEKEGTDTAGGTVPSQAERAFVLD
jgi:hypothetical protein